MVDGRPVFIEFGPMLSGDSMGDALKAYERSHREFVKLCIEADQVFAWNLGNLSHRFRMAWMYLKSHCGLENWGQLTAIFEMTSNFLGAADDLNYAPNAAALQGVYDAWSELCAAKKRLNDSEHAES